MKKKRGIRERNDKEQEKRKARLEEGKVVP